MQHHTHSRTVQAITGPETVTGAPYWRSGMRVGPFVNENIDAPIYILTGGIRIVRTDFNKDFIIQEVAERA